MKRVGVLVVAVAVLAGACGVARDEVRVGPLPKCDTTSRGLLILMAQAVPTAHLVPCLEDLPEGWELERTRVESGRAVLTLDNPGIGDIVVTLAGSCDPQGKLIDGAGPAASQVFESATGDLLVQSVVFDGGCVTIETPPRLAAREMTGRIGYLSREQLRAASDLDL